jgi:hypothetical protein
MTKQKYTHHCKKCKKDIISFTLEGPEKCPHCFSVTWDIENGYDPKHLLLGYRNTKGKFSPSKAVKDRSDSKSRRLRPSLPGYI